jgi:hypothetical protein
MWIPDDAEASPAYPRLHQQADDGTCLKHELSASICICETKLQACLTDRDSFCSAESAAQAVHSKASAD